MSTNYQCITNIDALKNYIKDSKVLAFDFETAPDDMYRRENKAAVDSNKAHIVGCSFSNADYTGVYVPLKHRLGTNMDFEIFINYFKELMYSESIIKVVHNLPFEAAFCYKHGIIVQEPVYDTLQAMQMTIREDFKFRTMQECGLKRLALEIFNEKIPTFEDVTDGRYFDELDPQDYETIRYGCADSDFAFRLRKKANEWFDKFLPKHRWIVENIESPTAVYVGMMKHNGIPVDKEKMLHEQDIATNKIKEIKEKIAFIIGDIKIGDNASTDTFKKYLFDILQLPVIKEGKNKKPALDDEVVQRLKDWSIENKPEITELFTLIQEYRKWQKLNKTYVEGQIKFINSKTNNLHPNLMQLATKTGRFACDAPNIQNLPRKGQDPMKIRDFIVAPDGYSILESDYSQAELRIAAYLSNDEALLQCYKDGIDVHATTTAHLFNMTIDEAKDEKDPQYKTRRAIAKATIFGTFYGISGSGLSVNLYTEAGLHYTKEQCNDFINSLLEKYSGYDKWQRETRRFARHKSYIETAYGRRRYLIEIQSKDYGKKMSAEREAINTPVQGLCADLIKLSMGRLIKELKDKPYIKPIFTVHDSLVFLVKDEYIDEAKDLIKHCMEATPPLLQNFQNLVADIAIGKTYGSL